MSEWTDILQSVTIIGLAAALLMQNRTINNILDIIKSMQRRS